jgi:hypothetical protein
MVAKPSVVLPKKNITAPPSKRLKRAAAVTTSLEVHQPSASSDNVSNSYCTRLFCSWPFLIQLFSIDFDAEVPLSWCWVRQDSGVC